MNPVLKIIQCGVGLSLQDSGRIGWKRFGVARAGCMDAFSAERANRLVGNLTGDCVLEMLMGGAVIEVLQDTWIAFCGAGTCSEIDNWSAKKIRKGTILRIHAAGKGLWSYLAVPGGFDAPQYFASCSFHARSGIGEYIVEASVLYQNQQLSACETSGNIQRSIPLHDRRAFSSCPPLRLFRGPHFRLFSEETRGRFEKSSWQISLQSDRTGYRLKGEMLESPAMIKSFPNRIGSIQITPSGAPIVTLHDGPTVGGYPVIGIIDREDLSWFVQQAPLSNITFKWHE